MELDTLVVVMIMLLTEMRQLFNVKQYCDPTKEEGIAGAL